MVEKIFSSLGESYHPGSIAQPTTFYFSIGETKKTVTLTPATCRVEEGRTVESADCICKMDGELLLRVWSEGYRPGVSDFLSGTVKSNNPAALKKFLAAFGK